MTDSRKQAIAAELNLSETAFVACSWKDGESRAGDNSFTLRWFTPTIEFDLCGHATLATACALFDRMSTTNDAKTTLYFESKKKGTLTATITWATKRIALGFPANPPSPIDASKLPCLPELIAKTFGSEVNANEVDEVAYSPGMKYLLVRLKGSMAISELPGSKIRAIQPDFNAMMSVRDNTLVRGIIVTIKGQGDVDFLSRVFAPWSGVNEDPVTGSAHTVLAPYWSQVYGGRTSLLGRQCSKRGGDVHCTLVEDRVMLEGGAKIVVRGDLYS